MRLTKTTWVKVALIILLCLAVLGALTGGCASVGRLWDGFGGAGSCARGTGESLAPGGGTFTAADIDSLDVDWAAGSVTIEVVGDGADVTLAETYVGPGRQPQTVAYVDGRTLVVDYGVTGGFMFGCAAGHKELVIQVPASLAERLDLVSLSAASGDYALSGIRCDRLLLEQASGRTTASDVTAREMDVELASGAMVLGVSVSERAGFDIASGNVEARLGGEVPHDVTASLASGDLRLLVPDGTGFTAQVDKVSGSFESAFPCTTDGNLSISGDGGPMHVWVTMTSGHMVIGKA